MLYFDQNRLNYEFSEIICINTNLNYAILRLNDYRIQFNYKQCTVSQKNMILKSNLIKSDFFSLFLENFNDVKSSETFYDFDAID